MIASAAKSLAAEPWRGSAEIVVVPMTLQPGVRLGFIAWGLTP